ncbi:substrate-binding domain-containing protein [Streptomyces beijiangensis]|uniref:DeoR/GlpR family transcriptional regulator n=1 Tax=Streptomyces beijiangensis TaxID=163361 RepID=A0A939JLF5_9ACTN|nr:substrate-binding domain-containing protein [Streptomyces beijiangensis]MBO0516350.1 DeoR/GlpR family transcriptional regulator [Streptomyces beijiangensis]
MREPVDLRRRRILSAVQSRGSVKVIDLAAELAVSVVTLRRDVEELAREGKLRRGHGVARSMAPVEAASSSGQPPADGDAVALVVPERHSYLYETLHGARTVLEAAGMRIALHIAPRAAGAEQSIVERALADGARGLLIAPRWRSAAAEQADYGWLAQVKVPAVLMERRPRPGSALHAMDSVCSDHWYGTHLAVEHLVALGHRRIVLASRNDSPTARAIRAAFAQIAADRPEIDDWAMTLSAPDADAEPAVDRGPQPGLAALLRERGATAAVLHGDVDALMLVQQLSDDGVRVPQDCSVVAYDDMVAALGGTPLTAVAPPKAEIGRAAAELLLHRLDQPVGAGTASVRRVELMPELKVRGSAQAPTAVAE